MEDFSPYAPPAAGSLGAGRAQDVAPVKGHPQASAFVAGLLSLLFPALGHVYAGRRRRAAGWLAILPVSAIIVCAAVLAGGRAALAILIWALLVAQAFAIRRYVVEGFKVYLEKLEDRAYLTFYDEIVGGPHDEGPYYVKEGEAFVVGDNRWNAHDSRRWFGGEGGGVKLASAIGIPYVVWLSVDEGGINWSRLGLSLDRPNLSRSMASLKPELARCLGR